MPQSAHENFQPGHQAREEISELDGQPKPDSNDFEKVNSEDQNYQETVQGVRSLIGWTHIPDFEYSPTSWAGNLWNGHRTCTASGISFSVITTRGLVA